jgi:hypothetical protein
MRSVSIAKRSEFHFDQRFQGQDGELCRHFTVFHIRGRGTIIISDFLAGKDDVDCVARPSVGAVEEQLDGVYRLVDEARLLHGLHGRGQILPTNQNIYVLRKAHGALINSAHPLGNRVPAAHDAR